MSSYHQLIVNQMQQDRQRLANPGISSGARYEISMEAVAQHVNAREKSDMVKKYAIVRRLAAKCQNAIVGLFERQVTAHR